MVTICETTVYLLLKTDYKLETAGAESIRLIRHRKRVYSGGKQVDSRDGRFESERVSDLWSEAGGASL